MHRILIKRNGKCYMNNQSTSEKKLIIAEWISIGIMYIGLLLSYIFWKNCVDGQFGLFIAFTFIFFVMINIVVKIPALICLIFSMNDMKQLKKSGIVPTTAYRVALVVNVVSMAVCLILEFIMFMNTEGSSLG